jgi:murein DD-endopeptidase MepM/ murein hydrolase activator NlpD
MPRKLAPRGATPLTQSETPLHRRPFIWLATVGALLLVMGLSLSGPRDALEPSTAGGSRAIAIETPLVAELDPDVLPELVIEASPEPPWRDFTVQDGDNLSLIFNRAGFTDTDLYRVARANDDRSLKRIYPGETIGFQSNVEGDLLTLRHVQSPLLTTLYSLQGDVYVATDLAKQPDRVARDTSMTIDSSLFIAGTQAGLSDAMIMELAGIFGGVIDFVLDPRTGDTIHVLYEELMLDGARFDDGPILAASFTNRGETFEAYRYTDVEGDTSYYNQKGVSMRKAFLLAPLDFTRVSSNFNPNRLHPIYKTQRPHRGTDYAAPRGTPVYAAGDGRVIEAGYTRANGNYAFIQHGEQFETHYLHLHRLKVKKGARVTQGDVIGTVGSTGAATGPHLHYEFLVNGVHRNPRTVHKMLPKARSLPEDELPRYLASIRQPTQQLASLRSAQQLASAE